MATGGQRISRVAGAPLPMRGNDIDTDRIIPARFLRSIRFEGLEAHVFEDDRKALAEAGTIAEEDLQLFKFVETADEAFEAMRSWTHAGERREHIPGRAE